MQKFVFKVSTVVVFIWCFMQLTAFGQADSVLINSSPYAVIHNHLGNLKNNHYHPEKAALSFPVDREQGITYDTPPALIDSFVIGIRVILEQHPYTRKDVIEVHLNDFGASALNIMVFTFFDVSDYSLELKSRHEVMTSIIQLAEELGVQFAFPTQTLHIETMPNQYGTSPALMEHWADQEHVVKELGNGNFSNGYDPKT